MSEEQKTASQTTRQRLRSTFSDIAGGLLVIKEAVKEELHRRQFRKNHDRLIAEIEAQSPKPLKPQASLAWRTASWPFNTTYKYILQPLEEPIRHTAIAAGLASAVYVGGGGDPMDIPGNVARWLREHFASTSGYHHLQPPKDQDINFVIDSPDI